MKKKDDNANIDIGKEKRFNKVYKLKLILRLEDKGKIKNQFCKQVNHLKRIKLA